MKAIIWDLDGTLLNTLHDLANAVRFGQRKYGQKEIEDAQVAALLGHGVHALVEGACKGVDEKTKENIFSSFYTEYAAHFADFTHPYDGMVELLTQFKQEGYLMAVISNKAHEMTVQLIEKFFPNTFLFVYGEQKDYPRKPNPSLLLDTLKKMKVSKEETVYIGDSEVDEKTAKNAGVSCILVSWGFRRREDLLQIPADYLVDSVEELRLLFIK